MTYAFTLRLEDSLARAIEKKCQNNGCTKTGLIKKLLRDFLKDERNTDENSDVKKRRQKLAKRNRNFANMVGVISLGGDSVRDCDDIFDEEF